MPCILNFSCCNVLSNVIIDKFIQSSHNLWKIHFDLFPLSSYRLNLINLSKTILMLPYYFIPEGWADSSNWPAWIHWRRKWLCRNWRGGSESLDSIHSRTRHCRPQSSAAADPAQSLAASWTHCIACCGHYQRCKFLHKITTMNFELN